MALDTKRPKTFRRAPPLPPGEALARIKPAPELSDLLERARGHTMTPTELHAQRRSWVIGELLLGHPDMTREEAEALADRAAPSP